VTHSFAIPNRGMRTDCLIFFCVLPLVISSPMFTTSSITLFSRPRIYVTHFWVQSSGSSRLLGSRSGGLLGT
jgi:hypothetical protein